MVTTFNDEIHLTSQNEDHHPYIKPTKRPEDLKKQKLVLRSQSTMFALAVFLLLLTETTAHKPHDTSGHGRGCIAREREALLSIKAGMVDDDSLSLFSSWHGQDCCRWMGVRCSNRTGHVVKLDLHEGFLVGEISSSLKDLEHLQHLDLSVNYLTGPRGRLPDFLGSLHDLRYLNLSGLNFSGPVPHQLGNLSKLRYLDLASGYDQLYSKDISWLRQLSSLKYLDMTSVNLSTVTGWVDTLNMLSFLEVLRLTGCWLPPNNSTVHSAPHTNLTRLKTLDLSFNSFETFHSVAFVWGATSLKHLNLEENMIDEVLPAELGNLSALEILQLSGSFVKGMLPDTLINLCNLKIIDLTWNEIEGDVTGFIERLPKCSLSKLQVLLLDHNNITGSLPDSVSRMTSLITLNLAFNGLTGNLTTGIGNLSNLTYLDLRYNQMGGLITEEHFSKLPHLQELHLSANSFTMEWNSEWVPPFGLQILGLKSCCVGPGFPQWLKWQENISELYMSNASIADTMPDWFWVVFSKAAILDLSNNNISGSLPATLGQMEASLLDLSSNQFIGSVKQIPPNITTLDLSRNSLSGPLPLNIRSPLSVDALVLSDNYFTGTIPTSICQMKSLKLFDIGNNMITGQLPQCSEYMASRSSMVSPDTASPITDSNSNTSTEPMSIETLRLNNNNLSDEFPLLLQNCPELTFIDLGQNKFFGSIPAWIGEKLAHLGILRLRSNMFSGYIPSQLRRLVRLQYLDLAHNNLSGNIPESLLNMDGVNDIAEIEFVYNPSVPYGNSDEVADSLGPDPYASISAVTKGQQREYTGHFIYMVNLDLSCNHLTGGIPKRIGPTTGLVNMNLSRNHLTGKIPENIGSMHSLESLDLSDNKISGEIPSSLSDLTSLSYLNLSYNNLSGRIPSGHQLDALNPTNPASMYTGNIGLCGPPLRKSCSGSTVQSHFSISKEGSEIMTLYYGLSVGFVVGLWVVFCSLLFKKTWRTSYFLLFDEQCDALYVLAVVNWARMTTKATPTN
ncbi:receptor-like protein EIX1 [Triticum aestivum]|nr:receptor-like protein EIX1 [Aegilops tauschii subsp. strangulata]XP_044396147.1 receptor-like protein EIX1 [Triticum aestivum]